MATFGERVRQLRKEKNMTQRELADSVEIDVTYLSKIETGKFPPPAADKVVAMAKALHTDEDELLVLARKAPRDLIAHAIKKNPQVLKFLRVAPQIDQKEIADFLEDLTKKSKRKK